MRILACNIVNFGKHHNVKFTLNEGFNIMNAENGWGKSTFAAFIRVMFYGMSQKKRGEKYDRTDYRKNYYPWQGGKFGGSLTFEYRGREYHLERYFGEHISDDTCTVIDMQTMKVTPEFGNQIGEQIFGIDAEGFERSIYIPHNYMDVISNDSVNTRLMGLIEDKNDMSNYERAMNILEEARKDLKKTGGRGRIDINRDRIDQDKIKLREKESLINEKNRLEEELNSAGLKKSNAESMMENSDRSISSLNEESKKKFGHNSFLAAGLIFIVAGIVAIIVNFGNVAVRQPSVLWNLLSILFVITGVMLILLKIMMSGRYKGAMDSAASEAINARKDFADAAAEEAKIKLRLEEIDRELLEADELKHSISTMEADQESDNEKLELIIRTTEFLRSAKNSLAVSYMEKMKENFHKYITEVMSSEQVVMDNDFNITIMKSGSFRQIENQSTGTQDMINLCARFALVDSLYSYEKPCVILDDVLSNLDDNNYEKAMQAIEKLSESFQVIYLTCHSSRAEQVKKVN